MAQMMTQSEYAKHRAARGLSGGTSAAVLKAIRSGRINATDGKIDPDAADRQWEAKTRKHAGLHMPAASDDRQSQHDAGKQAQGLSYADAKARSEAAAASLKELELARRRGDLVDRSGTERAAYAFGRILQKTLVDVLPSKLAMELAALADPWQVECFLRDKIRHELDAVSRMTSDEVSHAGG